MLSWLKCQRLVSLILEMGTTMEPYNVKNKSVKEKTKVLNFA